MAQEDAAATSVTVPGVYGTDLLAGVWKYTTTYTTSGAVRTVGSPTQPVDPTVGGTPGFEYTTTGYNRIGQPDSQWPTATPSPLPGVGLVEGTVFDPLGRVTSRLLSTTGGGGMVQQFAYQTDTGRLASSSVGFGTLAAVSSVFVNDQYSYDLRGNVTAIIDGGKEPSGVASGVKECFLYDTRDRLIRAHTATITGTCATTTASTSTAAGTLAAYDTRWTFDDLGRTRTVRDMLAAATVTYNYATSRHAITSLTGAATAAYTYNPVGAMTTRNTTALGYDAMQRLTSYGSIDTNLYRASNQRLIRTSSTTRTLYVPGMDVTVSGGVRTITRTLTIDGTPYGTRTLAGGATATMWNCTNPQHTLTCTTPAGSTSIPPRTRYSPYGTPRTTTTITNTDRGHLNQPHDPTGLTYLNNRYYDPTINAFTSVDPLVGKTATPYLYAGGNPATFADPNGLDRFADRHEDCKFADLCGQQLGCIRSGSCGGQDLVDSINDTRSGLGGWLFAGIEGADTGGRLDGNWGAKSIAAAANGGSDLVTALAHLGLKTSSTEFWKSYNLIRSVASRLVGHKDSYERIDHERSWWNKHGGQVLSWTGMALTLLSFTPCGVLCAAGAATLSTVQAAQTCSNGSSGVACAISVTTAVVSVGAAGAQAAASIASTASTTSARVAAATKSIPSLSNLSESASSFSISAAEVAVTAGRVSYGLTDVGLQLSMIPSNWGSWDGR